LHQRFGGERGTLECVEPLQIDHRELLAEDVGESALGDAPHERHLSALETEAAGIAATGFLAFFAASRRFAQTRARPAPDALGLVLLADRRVKFT